MYPKLSDLFNALVGSSYDFSIQTFSFFFILSFIVGGIFLYFQLKEKEISGKLRPLHKKIQKDKPPSLIDIFISVVISYLIGYKIIGIGFQFDEFMSEPIHYLLIWKGSHFGGLLFAVISIAINLYFLTKMEQKVFTNVMVYPHHYIFSMMTIIFIFSIIGAKFGGILEFYNNILGNLKTFMASSTTMNTYSGIFTGLLIMLLFIKNNGLSLSIFTDTATPAFCLGTFIGFFGSFLAGKGFYTIQYNLPIFLILSLISLLLFAINFILKNDWFIPGFRFAISLIIFSLFAIVCEYFSTPFSLIHTILNILFTGLLFIFGLMFLLYSFYEWRTSKKLEKESLPQE